MLAVATQAPGNLHKNRRARAVELVDAAQIEDDERTVRPHCGLDLPGELFGGAKEDWPFQLEDDDAPAGLGEEFRQPWLENALGAHGIAAIGAAYDGAA